MHAMDARAIALIFEPAQLLDIGGLCRNRLPLPAIRFASSSTRRCSTLRIGISRARPPLVQLSLSNAMEVTVIRWTLNQIFTKLDVRNRIEAC